MYIIDPAHIILYFHSCNDDLGMYTVFVSLNEKSGFYNIRIDQLHLNYYIMVTPESVYIHDTMPFGFKTASQHFLPVIQIVVGKALRPNHVIYVDHIPICERGVHDNQ